MLRTKVDEIGCYYRKKMIFSIFSKNHFQKSRVGPENRFRISRFFIQPKTKKTRGTDRNPAQPRPETPSAYRLATQKYTFPTKKQGRNDTFPRCRHIHHRKKKGNEAQNKPPQTSSRQKRQIPQADTQNTPQPTKQSQRKNISRFSGPTMRMESVPFQKLMLQALKINDL